MICAMSTVIHGVTILDYIFFRESWAKIRIKEVRFIKIKLLTEISITEQYFKKQINEILY